MNKDFSKKRIGTVLLLVAAVLVLTFTNYTKVLMSRDTITRDLYGNSVSLVYDVIVMRYQNYDPPEYGLGYLTPYNGANPSGITDESLDVVEGYGVSEKILVVANNEITQREYAPGNVLTFLSGDQATVIGFTGMEDRLIVSYEAEKVYSVNEQGPLMYVTVYNTKENRYMRIGDLMGYESQYGLQGKVICALPLALNMHMTLIVAKAILAFLFALFITLITYELFKRYNLLFAAVFYLVCALSPWMIGYSTNVYWVECTWFLPMLVGIVCLNHIDKRAVRICSYIFMFFAIAIKSACGYEYISTIMLGGIVFLLTELTCLLIDHKDTARIKRVFLTTFFIGLSALMGFVAALLVHAYLRGQSDIYHGLRAIYFEDVLRRTYGSADRFQDVYADSLNASVFRVVAHYLKFDTSLILGVSKYLFIPLIAVSFIILVVATAKKAVDKEYLVLYIWLGITAVSWFVLGKAHSYIHTSMNYVMWYFGYMQMIFYVPVWAIYKSVTAYLEKRKDAKRSSV